MTEEELQEANGLVARFYRPARGGGFFYTDESRFDFQRQLLVLGVKLKTPLPAPDPRAPPGGSAVALRKVA